MNKGNTTLCGKQEELTVLFFLFSLCKCASLLDRQDVLRKHAVGSANAVLCKTDEDVASKAIRECKSHTVNMVWCGLSDYFSQMERETKERVDVDSILDEARSAMESRGGENGGPKRSTLADILAVPDLCVAVLRRGTSEEA